MRDQDTWWITHGEENDLYVKRGRRYFPATQVTGYERFEGFPADGVWLVSTQGHSRSQRLIKRVEAEQLLDLEEVKRLASLERYRDVMASRLVDFGRDLSDALFNDRKCAYSITEIVDALIAEMAALDQKEEAVF